MHTLGKGDSAAHIRVVAPRCNPPPAGLCHRQRPTAPLEWVRVPRAEPMWWNVYTAVRETAAARIGGASPSIGTNLSPRGGILDTQVLETCAARRASGTGVGGTTFARVAECIRTTLRQWRPKGIVGAWPTASTILSLSASSQASRLSRGEQRCESAQGRHLPARGGTQTAWA